MPQRSVATDVRKKVARSRNRFWRPEDFDGSHEAVAKALSRLARAGELRRVRRGLYWRGAPTPLGMAPPPSDRFVHEIIDAPGIGPAGWSAGLALGLSTQVPRCETIAVPGRAPRSPGAVRFVSRAASVKRRDERLRPIEVALLEVLRDWDTLVEVPTHAAVARIADVIEKGELRLDRVVRASRTEPPRVRERLRHLLEAMGKSIEVAAVRPVRIEAREVGDQPDNTEHQDDQEEVTMGLDQWESKALEVPGAEERVREIEDELRLAARLTALREKAGVSQRELAERTGVSQPRIAAIERSRNVTIGVLEQYVKALGGRLEVSVVQGSRRTSLLGAPGPTTRGKSA